MLDSTDFGTNRSLNLKKNVISMTPILWIIGAGASFHLGMPLLNQFLEFFKELWEFKENRVDPEFVSTIPETIRLMEAHPGINIEVLLSGASPLTDDQKLVIKRAIGRGFVRRNLGRGMKSFYPKDKFGPYSHLLGQMCSADSVVSFNYDNALEIPLCLITRNLDILDTAELDSAQLAYLNDGRAMDQWIPSRCISELERRSFQYEPQRVFLPTTTTVAGAGPNTISLIKIHGSVNWFAEGDAIRVGRSIGTNRVPLIIYPEAEKPQLIETPQSQIVQSAVEALHSCTAIVIIGYSFPESDSVGHPFVSELARLAPTKQIVAIDPTPSDHLKRVVGVGTILDITFEEAVLPDHHGESLLKQEIDRLRH